MQQPNLRMTWDGSGMPIQGFAPYHHSGMSFMSGAYVYGGLPTGFVPPPPPPPPPMFAMPPQFPFWNNNQSSKQDEGLGSIGLIFATTADGRTVVSHVRPGSSAALSGIIAERDVLEAVDRFDVSGLSLPKIGAMIVGRPGSSVNLSFSREREGDIFKYDLELVRTPNEGLNAEEIPFIDERLPAENERMYLMASSPHSADLNEDSQTLRGAMISGRDDSATNATPRTFLGTTIRARERERHHGSGEILSESVDSASNSRLSQNDPTSVPFSVFQSEQALRVQREKELDECKETNVILQSRVEEMQMGLENAHHTIKRIEDGVHMIEQARDEERRMRHASEGEKMALQARIDELVAELIRVYESNQEAKTLEIGLKEDIKQKEETITAMQTRITDLIGTSMKSEGSVSEFNAKLRDAERARQSLMAELEVTKAESAELHASQQKKIAELQENLQNVQDAFSVAVSVVRKAKEEEQMKRLEAEEKLRKEQELAEAKLAEIKEHELKQLQNAVLEFKANKERLQAETQDLQGRIVDLEKASLDEKLKRMEAERLLKSALENSTAEASRERSSAPLDNEKPNAAKLLEGNNDSTQHVKNLESRIAQLLYEREQADVESNGISGLYRLCVLALPPAVALVRELCKDTASLSSSTWAHMRAQEYIAKVASFQSPVSTIDLVSAIYSPDASTPQYHTLLLAGIFSCYSKDRLDLLLDSRIVPSLVKLLQRNLNNQTSASDDFPALRNSFQSVASDRDKINPEEREEILCARYSAMTLSNFSLEVSGRARILDCIESIEVLINAINSTDKDCATFSLICLGNLFFETRARTDFLRRNCVQLLVEALRSKDADVVRFAAGALRNFCSDPQACPAVTEVQGVHRCLQELISHPSERVRDHSRACLTNLRVNSTREGVSASVTTPTGTSHYVMPVIEHTYVTEPDVRYSHARYVLPS